MTDEPTVFVLPRGPEDASLRLWMAEHYPDLPTGDEQAEQDSQSASGTASEDMGMATGTASEEDGLATGTAAEEDQMREDEQVEVRGALRRISIVRGGPGSGHFGHEGRPGEVGGSQEGTGGKAQTGAGQVGGGEDGAPPQRQETEPPPIASGEIGEGGVLKKIGDEEVRFDSEEQYLLIQSLAEQKVGQAKGVEADYTNMMQSLATAHGGELVGLEYDLKSAASMTRKIRMDMLEKGLTEEEAAAQVTDANRYTMVFDADQFVAKATEVQTGLQEQGWTMYDHKWKNYYQTGDAYDGYNTVMINNETGQLFELQFHTPESIRIKEQSHELYNQFRVLGADQQTERRSLWDRMVKLWDESPSYSKPPNWWLLQGVMK